MWADSLLTAERHHLLLLLVWAASSIIAATLLLVILTARRLPSPLLRHFAIQVAGWGALIGIVALVGWHGLHLRDVAGAARLERVVWLNIGLDLGYVATGVTLAVASRLMGRRMGAVGAGLGIVLHGLALLLLDLQFAVVVSR